jgi:hypothetical protein
MGETNLFLILGLEYACVRETEEVGFDATEKSRPYIGLGNVEPRLKAPSNSVNTGLFIWTDRKGSLSVCPLQQASSPLPQLSPLDYNKPKSPNGAPSEIRSLANEVTD